MDVYADSETRSSLDLKKVGPHKYARHPDTDALCVTWAVDNDGVRIWKRGEPPPVELQQAAAYGARFYFHNAEFDTQIWGEILVKRHGWVPLRPSQVRCTMAMAQSLGLPRSLDAAAKAVGVAAGKDAEGHKVMMKLCRPAGYDDDLRPVWHTDAALYDKLYSYAGQDIRVMWNLRRRILDLRADEQRIYELTSVINSRGIRLDLPPVQHALAMVAEATKELNRKVKRLTNDSMETANQRDKMIEFCGDHLVGLPNLRRKTLELLSATRGDFLPPIVQELINVRLEAAKTSTAKLRSMLARVCHDGRVRGSLIFYGAATGRFSSVGVQLHNLPRPALRYDDCCFAVELIRRNDRTMLEFLYGSTLPTVSDCLRSFIIPEPSCAFAVIDLSKIEAVVGAWVAGQHDLLEAFRQGRDTYAEMAARVYRRHIDREVDVVEGQVGKALILGAGYGLGGTGFWLQCVLNGIPIEQAFAQEAIKTYRSENEKIVDYWYELESTAIKAVENPGRTVECGPVTWLLRGNVLLCRLPSGRALGYPYPVVRELPDKYERLWPCLCYRMILPGTNTWGESDTYGAALFQNVVEGIARDILTDTMLQSEDEGVPNVLSVHDEIVAESDHAERDLRVLIQIAQEERYWAPGLPVVAKGKVMQRYGKM